MCLLQHHAQTVSQVALADVINADAVDSDFAVLNVIETVNQIGNGRLACASAAHKGDFLVRHGVDIDVEQHLFVFVVAKVHIIELYAA